MVYSQVKPFNQSKAGTTHGMCLQNVRLGYNIPAKYSSALEAWRHTKQHRTRTLPSNVDVPLFYDYTDSKGNNYGHINVRLKDGRVWNDGKLFSSLSAFEKDWSNVRYVGWGESVNDVSVIKQEEEFVIEEQRPVFKASYYASVNPDLAKNGVKTVAQLQAHWLKYGIKEGRPSAPNFHVKEYLANYPDLVKAFGATGYKRAINHYFNSGINEGRNGRKRNPVANAAQATLDKIKELLK